MEYVINEKEVCMKQKVLLILCVCLIWGADVFALPFLDGVQETFTYEDINGRDYSIVDRNVTGTYDGEFRGYWSEAGLWSGYYLGTVTQIDGLAANESVEILNDLISYYMDSPYDIAAIDKYDVGSGLEDDGPGLLDINLVDMTWTTTSGVEFYTVKGATDFALYYIPELATSGKWTAEHLLNRGDNNPTLSHLSVVYDAAPVPEPGTLILLGMGLFGLAGYGRKRLNK